MQIWLELISRELLFAALLLALGSGPAAFLPPRWGNTVRFALAPVFGLCVGAGLTDTLVYAFPAHQTSWVVVAVALLSLVLAVWRGLKLHRPSLTSVGQVAVIVVVVLGAFSYPLAARHTVGPAGGYEVGDAAGYMSETNGEQRTSIQQAAGVQPPFADLSLGYWVQYANSYQQLDVSALEANVNPLLGLGSTETYTPFLIAVILAGALGAFATVRRAGGAITWPAVLAGCLFAGPVFTELFMDGSQAALAGCALLAPLVLVGWEALRLRETATLVLFALLAAGLQTVYPLFVPCIVIGALATVIVVVGRRLTRGIPAGRELAVAFAQLAGVLTLAAAFTPLAFSRNIRYWTSVLGGHQAYFGLPVYDLPFNVLPGWVLGTREFYGLVALQGATLGIFFMAAVVPALIAGVIAIGGLRNRLTQIMFVIAAGAALLAYYTASRYQCGYCVQRNLIPLAALAVPAVALGIVALAALGSRPGTVVAVLVALGVTLAVGHESVIVHQRLENGSYLLEPQVRETVSALPSKPGPVELEGFTETVLPPIEEPDVYDLLDEKTHENVSQPTATDDGSALFYLGGQQPLGPSFRANYQYVLTRLAGIATQRRVVARHGPIVLERRTHGLDVTITGGVLVAPARMDPTGTAWLRGGPLEFLVVGGNPGSNAWISLVFRRTVPVHVRTGRGLFSVRRRGGQVDVCVKASGAPPVREASVLLDFTPQPPPAPTEPHEVPLPSRGVSLVSMSVSSMRCPRGVDR
jgi:hypothetical protein